MNRPTHNQILLLCLSHSGETHNCQVDSPNMHMMPKIQTIPLGYMHSNSSITTSDYRKSTNDMLRRLHYLFQKW